MTVARFIACCIGGAIVAHIVVSFIAWDWNPGHWAPDMRIVTIAMLAPALGGLIFLAGERRA